MLHTFYRSVVQVQVRYFHSLQDNALMLYGVSVILRGDVGTLGFLVVYPVVPPRCPYFSLYVLPPRASARI